MIAESPMTVRHIDVSVVLPSYNEAANIAEVIHRAQKALADYPNHQVIVVDDNSPDGTWEIVDELGQTDPRIQCYRRIDRHGLSSAIIDGLNMGDGDAMLVMDADLQHDPDAIPKMVAELKETEIVVASRYIEGGGTSDWGAMRRFMSRFATKLSHWTLGLSTSDPMSGFFGLRRSCFENISDHLQPRGFKTLMEILVRAKGASVGEVAYTFGSRHAGDSKLGSAVLVDFFLQLIELRTGHVVSGRFFRYCLVGASGVLMQLGAFNLIRLGDIQESLALGLAILLAMLSNFILNNIWTFKDRGLSVTESMSGFIRFALISGIGAFINHSISLRVEQITHWDLTWASLIGIAVATVWNYQLNKGFTWGIGKPSE